MFIVEYNIEPRNYEEAIQQIEWQEAIKYDIESNCKNKI